LAVASQIYNRFKAAGKALNDGDVAIVDAAKYHYYQVCTRVTVDDDNQC
jgi:sulfide:quinone oxidoreductase